MDVVVDEVVAVLKVLAFRDAVRTDQQIDLGGLAWQHHGLLLGARGEQRQQLLEIVTLLERGLRSAFAGDLGGVQPLPGKHLGRQVGVQVIGGVGEGGEDQHLFVAGVDRVCDFAQHVGLEVLKLGVVFGRDAMHLGQQGIDEQQVGLQFALPGWEVHVGQADLDFAANVVAGVDGQVVFIGFQVVE